MQKVLQKLENVREVVEAQKIEIEMLKKQLQELEMKLDILEKKLGLLRTKKQKSSQQLAKLLLGTKNQAQLSSKQKTLESLIKAREEDKCQVVSLEENIAPRVHSSSAKNMQKLNYALVVVLKLAQALKYFWTQVVYKNRKTLAIKFNIKTKDQKKRIFFLQVLGQQKSNADLILALNKTLQKFGEEIRFCKV